jgi:hypothetical protein
MLHASSVMFGSMLLLNIKKYKANPVADRGG